MRRTRRRPCPGPGQRGISLVETVIALGILGFIGMAFLAALSTGSKSTRILNEQVVMEGLARSQLEDTKNAAYDPAIGYTVTVTAPPRYSVGLQGVTLSAGKQKITVTVALDGRTMLSVEDYKVDR